MIPVAEMLSVRRPLLGRIVQDHTGLTGPYNIELDFDFNNQPDFTGPSIFRCIEGTVELETGGIKRPASDGSGGRRPAFRARINSVRLNSHSRALKAGSTSATNNAHPRTDVDS
jgi:hypothetical protein